MMEQEATDNIQFIGKEEEDFGGWSAEAIGKELAPFIESFAQQYSDDHLTQQDQQQQQQHQNCFNIPPAPPIPQSHNLFTSLPTNEQQFEQAGGISSSCNRLPPLLSFDTSPQEVAAELNHQLVLPPTTDPVGSSPAFNQFILNDHQLVNLQQQPQPSQQIHQQPIVHLGICPGGSISNGSLNISDFIVGGFNALTPINDNDVEDVTSAQSIGPTDVGQLEKVQNVVNTSVVAQKLQAQVGKGNQVFESVHHLSTLHEEEEQVKAEFQEPHKEAQVITTSETQAAAQEDVIKENAQEEHKTEGQQPNVFVVQKAKKERIVDRSKFADISQHALEQLDRVNSLKYLNTLQPLGKENLSVMFGTRPFQLSNTYS